MRTISEKELNIIFENHRHWLKKDCDGWEKMRANLHNADLHNADLHGTNLHEADLHGADLHGADLHNADLHGTNLHEADLHGADLSGANLHNANLYGANLYGANLHDADLHSADLIGADLHGANLNGANLICADLYDANLNGADLSGANLHRADLHRANLHEADLRGVNLRYANLRDAKLRDAKNMPYVPMICPEEGEFIGWKKAMTNDFVNDFVIVKLLIPENAKRFSASSRKCRCDKAQVIEIYNLDGTIAEERKCHSLCDRNFIYEVGKTIEVKNFCENRWKECAAGIHFFINRQEAVDYIF